MEAHLALQYERAKRARLAQGFVPTQSVPYPLVSQYYLDNETPSRRVKIKKAVEAERLLRCANTIMAAWKEIGGRTPGTIVVALSALAYFHRFFAVKDMKSNDRLIVSIAALFLACKSEDFQLALNDVIFKFWSHRFKEPKPAEYARIKDPEFFQYIREQVLSAERSLLYALGFSLKIRHPNHVILDTWRLGRGQADPDAAEFWLRTCTGPNNLQSGAWEIANDTAMSRAILMYDTRNIAMANIYRAMQNFHIDPESVPKWDGKPFWEVHGAPGITLALMMRIIEVLREVYAAMPEVSTQHWRTLPWAQGPIPGSQEGTDTSPSAASNSTSVPDVRLEQGEAAAAPQSHPSQASPSEAVPQVKDERGPASFSTTPPMRSAGAESSGRALSEWYNGSRADAAAPAVAVHSAPEAKPELRGTDPASTSGQPLGHASGKAEAGAAAVKAEDEAKASPGGIPYAERLARTRMHSPGQNAPAVRSHIVRSSPYQSPGNLGKRTADGDLVKAEQSNDDSPLVWSP